MRHLYSLYYCNIIIIIFITVDYEGFVGLSKFAYWQFFIRQIKISLITFKTSLILNNTIQPVPHSTNSSSPYCYVKTKVLVSCDI